MLRQAHIMKKIASSCLPLQLIRMEILDKTWLEISLIVREEKRSLSVTPVLFNDPAINRQLNITNQDCIGDYLWGKIYQPDSVNNPSVFTEDLGKLSSLLSKYPNLDSILLTCVSEESLLLVNNMCQHVSKLSFLYPVDCDNFSKSNSFTKCSNLTSNVTEIAIGDRNDDQFIDRLCSSFPKLEKLILTSLKNPNPYPIEFGEAFSRIGSRLTHLHLRSRPVSFDAGICSVNVGNLVSLDVMNIVSRVDLFVTRILPKLHRLKHLSSSLLGSNAYVINKYWEEINLQGILPQLESLCLVLEHEIPLGQFIGRRESLKILKVAGKGEREYMFNEYDVIDVSHHFPCLQTLCITPIQMNTGVDDAGQHILSHLTQLKNLHISCSDTNVKIVTDSLKSGSKIRSLHLVPSSSKNHDDKIKQKKILSLLRHDGMSRRGGGGESIWISFQEHTHTDYLHDFNTCLCPYESLISAEP